MSSPDCQSTARHHAPGPVPLVFGFGLEVMGIEGGILRIGVVENGIMLEDFAPEASTFEACTKEAIHEACRLRFPQFR